MLIKEPECIVRVINTGKAPDGGLWLGGLKYSVVQYDPQFDGGGGDAVFVVCSAARPKKGVHLVSTGSQVVAAFYDENQSQTPGNARKAALAFAEYLKQVGY